MTDEVIPEDPPPAPVRHAIVEAGAAIRFINILVGDTVTLEAMRLAYGSVEPAVDDRIQCGCAFDAQAGQFTIPDEPPAP